MAKQPNPAKVDILAVPAEVLLDTSKAESDLEKFKKDANVEADLVLNTGRAKKDLSHFIDNAETALKRIFMKKKNNPLGISFDEMERGIKTTAALYESVLKDMDRNIVSAATNIRRELVEKMEAEFPNIKVNIGGVEVIGIEDIVQDIIDGAGDIKEIDLGIKDIKLVSSQAHQLEDTTEKIVENVQEVTKELTKQEKKDIWKQLGVFTRKIKNNLSDLSTSDMREVLDIIGKLKDTTEYGKQIEETFGHIAASFVGIGEVTGLQEVVEEFENSASALRNVQWGFGKLHDKNQLIEDQKIIIDQLKQIGKLRYSESRTSSGVDIFAEGFDDDDYSSKFTVDELRTRLLLLEQLRDNIVGLVTLTKSKKITLFDDDIYQPENIVYALDRSIRGAQSRLPAADEYDVPDPEELFAEFKERSYSIIDRDEMSKRLKEDFEFYREAILNGRYTVDDAISSFYKDIEVDQMLSVWEGLTDGIEIPQMLLSMPQDYAAQIRRGALEVNDAISYMREAIDGLQTEIVPDDLDGLDDLFESENLRYYNNLIEECTKLTGELSDAVAKHAKIQRAMVDALQSGNDIPQGLKDARDQIEDTISGYFIKDLPEPTLSTDGILMWLQSSEAAVMTIENLVTDMENKFERAAIIEIEARNAAREAAIEHTEAIEGNSRESEENLKIKTRIKNLVDAADTIPQEEGTTRLIHFTRPDVNKSIFESGLNMDNQTLDTTVLALEEYRDALEGFGKTLGSVLGVAEKQGVNDNAIILDIPTDSLLAYTSAVGGLSTVSNEFVKASIDTKNGLVEVNEAYNASHDVVKDYTEAIERASEAERGVQRRRPGMSHTDSMKAVRDQILSARNELNPKPIEQTSQAEQHLAESTEEANTQLKKQQDISTMVPGDIIDKITQGVDIEKMLTDRGLQGEQLTKGIDLFKDFAGSLYLGDDSPVSSTELFDELFDFVAQNAQRAESVEKTLDAFREHMKGVQIKIPESLEGEWAAEFTDVWDDLKKVYAIGGNSKNKKKLLTTSKYASTPAKIVEGLLAPDVNLGYALDHKMLQEWNGSDQDALRMLLDAIQRAKDEFKMPKMKTIFGLSEEEQTDFSAQPIEAGAKIDQSAMVLRASLKNTSEGNDALTESAERAAPALEREATSAERAAEAMRELQEAESEVVDEQPTKDKKQPVDIIPKIVDDALEQLRKASDNKTSLIDLTGVKSVEDLERQVGEMAQSIVGADLKVDSVVVQDDIARITLYNEQLGITASQMWRLTEATEDASKAQLEYISGTQKHSPRAVQRYSDSQRKKIDDANKWLISQMAALDKQELSYKHSSKKISGDTEILNLDDRYFGKTIDELANNIRSRISGAMDGALTESVQNEIKDALRVLSMEIRVAQSQKYQAGRLSAQEIESAKETSQYRLDAFEAKAIKNNVFTQLESDIKSMHAELDSVTNENSGGLQKFTDMMRTAEAHYSAEMSLKGMDEKEQRNYEKAERAQERLYKLKKDQAKLEAEGKTDAELSRHIEEQEARYNASLNILENEQKIADILAREATLETELANVRKSAESAQAEKTKAAEDKKFTGQLKSYYTDWLKTLKEINDLESQMNDLRLQDKGTGLYSGRIQDVQDLKSGKVAELRALEDAMNKSLSFDEVEQKGGFNAYLEYCRKNAILTADEIQKLDQELVKSEYIAQDFDVASAKQKQEKQKKAYEELKSWQKKYNEADYNWHKADIAGEDKTPYNQQMESYKQHMQDIRKELQLTTDQEIELNKINNEHMLRKKNLLNGVSEAEQKYNQQVADITDKVSSQMDEWDKDHSFTRIFPDDLKSEITAFKDSLSNLSQDTNFTALNKQWDNIVKKTQQATKANEKYIASAWKDRFQDEYKYSNGKTKQDQGALDHMADGYRQEAEQAQKEFERAQQEQKEFDENIESIYDRLMKTTKEMNSVDDKINRLTLKDGGKGLYSETIQSLRDQKSYLVSDLRSINEEIKSALTLDDVAASNPIMSFFEDTRVQAILTAEEIEKFQGALKEMTDKGFGFKENLAAKIQPFVEKLQSLKQMVAGGLIDDQDTKLAINQADEQYSQKWGQFAQNPDALNAADLLAFVNANNEYINSLEKAASKEAEYFKAKKQYANVTSAQSYDDVTASMERTSNSTNDARAKLEDFVSKFEGGQKVITGFTTSANGISKIDFSVLEEGTGNLRNFSAEMGQFTNNIYTVETSLKNMTVGTKSVENALASMQQIMDRLNARGFTADNNDYVADLQKRMQALKEAYITGQGDQGNLQNSAMDAERLLATLKQLENAYLNISDAKKKKEAFELGKFDKNTDSAEQFANALKQLEATMDGTVVDAGKFNGEIKQIPVTIETASRELKKFIIDIDKLSDTMVASLKGTEKAKTGWQEFLGGFGDIGKGLAQYGASLIGVYDFVRYLKQGFNEVLEIDTAMTELKKVTDETDIAYSNFLENAYTSSKKIGTTMKDFTQATADFARLGYTLDEASMLSEAANVYMNVGDGIDNVEDASKSIISTMKAFGIEAEDSMSIVNKFNEVGNNFAIDSVGIGEAFQRSASALFEAGNTIDESIALVTGANTVVYFVPRYYSNMIASR